MRCYRAANSPEREWSLPRRSGPGSLIIACAIPPRRSISWPRTSPFQFLLRPARPNRHTINIAAALGTNNASNTISNPACRNARLANPNIRKPDATKIRPVITNEFSIMQLMSMDGDRRISVTSRILTFTRSARKRFAHSRCHPDRGACATPSTVKAKNVAAALRLISHWRVYSHRRRSAFSRGTRHVASNVIRFDQHPRLGDMTGPYVPREPEARVTGAVCVNSASERGSTVGPQMT